jgi:hypothetical protein
MAVDFEIVDGPRSAGRQRHQDLDLVMADG